MLPKLRRLGGINCHYDAKEGSEGVYIYSTLQVPFEYSVNRIRKYYDEARLLMHAETSELRT